VSRRYLIGRDRRGDGSFAVDWVSGACLMARRETALALGGLDEGFFMHFEDADFCHRVKDSGRSVICVPAAQVVHAEGGCRRGWPASQVGHFHYGAYRYWTKHHAPQPWNPLRLVAAFALAARAGGVLASNRMSRRHASDSRHTGNPLGSPRIDVRHPDPLTRAMDS
jgi:GT2 family glycosyltransferase